jgi:hypothetical protein
MSVPAYGTGVVKVRLFSRINTSVKVIKHTTQQRKCIDFVENVNQEFDEKKENTTVPNNSTL